MVTGVLTDTGKTHSTTGQNLLYLIGQVITSPRCSARVKRLATKAIMLIWVRLLQVPLTCRLQRLKVLVVLRLPTDQMGTSGYEQQQFTGDVAQQYMNPYLQASLNPQLEEARRQAGITAAQNANKFAGAYGGSAQALYNAEADRNLGQNLSAITGQGYADAYDRGLSQFNTAQDRAMTAQDR